MAPPARSRRARRRDDRPRCRKPGRRRGAPRHGPDDAVARSAWNLLADDPDAVADALARRRCAAGATDEELGRAIAYAAALRIVRFHTRNDHADWDTVHHSFTAANALHQALRRNPTPELRARLRARRAAHLPRPLPQRARGAAAARDERGHSTRSRSASTIQGMVDEAANEAYGFLHAGGSRAELDRGARSRAPRRGRGLPLVPDRRSRRAPGRPRGPRARRSPRSSSSASRASSPRTRRPAASSRRSSASRRDSAARRSALYEDDTSATSASIRDSDAAWVRNRRRCRRRRPRRRGRRRAGDGGRARRAGS